MFARRGGGGDRKRPRPLSIEDSTDQGTDHPRGKRSTSNDDGTNNVGGSIGSSGTTRLSRIWTSLSSSSSSTTNNNNSSVSTTTTTTRLHQPLQGIVACLSGYTVSEKDELHSIIEDLGGRYTRDFSLDVNTHLIIETPVGAKYELAATAAIVDPTARTTTTTSSDANRQGKIHIVSRSWIDACVASKSHQKVSEANHRIHSVEDKQPKVPPTIQEMLSMVNEELSSMSSQYTDVENYDETSSNRFHLLDSFHFYLLGFQEDQNHIHSPKILQELKTKLSIMIRRCGGTIFWELKEDVNIVILCDGCDDILSKAAEVLSTHHPQLPPSVSPLWVIDSTKYNELRPFHEYLPHPAPPSSSTMTNDYDQASQLTKPADRDGKTASASASTTVQKRSSIITSSTSTQLSVFRGYLFALLRVPPQPDQHYVLDFDMKDETTFIKSRGGQLLSSELLDAIRADNNTSEQQQHQQQQQKRRWSTGSMDGNPGSSASSMKVKRRRCYVVCWGDANGPPRLETNQLLSQVKREDLCDLVLVTPIWLRTCVEAGKCVNPNRLPIVLQPQSWPMMSLVPRNLNRIATTKRQQKSKTKNDSSTTSQTDVESQHSKLSGGKKKVFPSTNTTTDHDSTTTTIYASLTGFQGTEKIALIETLKAIGCTYHDSMVPTNTHLICKDAATGLKREKAIDWSIHVVKVDWLYHILQHGIGGEKKTTKESGGGGSSSRSRGSMPSQANTEKGCESQFSAL